MEQEKKEKSNKNWFVPPREAGTKLESFQTKDGSIDHKKLANETFKDGIPPRWFRCFSYVCDDTTGGTIVVLVNSNRITGKEARAFFDSSGHKWLGIHGVAAMRFQPL